MWCREALEPPGDLLEPALDIEDGIHVPAGVEEANSSRRGEVREADHNQVGEHRAHDVQVRSVGTRRDICWISGEVRAHGRGDGGEICDDGDRTIFGNAPDTANTD
jgi:hypothetical protein